MARPASSPDLFSVAPELFRYERKFFISDLSYAEVRQAVLLNPRLFSPIFRPRLVNNIYFDTLEHDSFLDNVNGALFRVKARIRWYGELFGPVPKSTLELKLKRGLLGRKESFVLPPFTFERDFDSRVIDNLLRLSSLPADVALQLRNCVPTLVNRYCREYFRSADGRYRITLDRDQEFYGVGTHNNRFLRPIENNSDVILELKYAGAADDDAESVTNHFPFRLTKSSKYVQGVTAVSL